MNLNQVWIELQALVKRADDLMPGADGKAKKAWAVEQAVTLVERFDHMLPVLGKWADIAPVDAAERYLLGLGIEAAWTRLQIDQ